MPRSIQIAVPAAMAESMLQRLDKIDGVAGVAHSGVSIELEGDVLVIQTANDAVRIVFSALQKMRINKQGTVFTTDLKSLVSPGERISRRRFGSATGQEQIRPEQSSYPGCARYLRQAS